MILKLSGLPWALTEDGHRELARRLCFWLHHVLSPPLDPLQEAAAAVAVVVEWASRPPAASLQVCLTEAPLPNVRTSLWLLLWADLYRVCARYVLVELSLRNVDISFRYGDGVGRQAADALPGHADESNRRSAADQPMWEDIAPPPTFCPRIVTSRSVFIGDAVPGTDCWRQFEKTVLGGTFDHFHNGHKMFLTTAAHATRNAIVVGISCEELLRNKKFLSRLEPFEQRARHVADFIRFLNPHLLVDIYPLHDPFGPSVTMKDLDAIAVTPEVASAVPRINEIRVGTSGFKPLSILMAPLVMSIEADPCSASSISSKLSSTSLRDRPLHE